MQKLPKIRGSMLAHGALLCLIVLYFLSTMHMPLISTAGFEAANLFVLLFGPLFCLVSACKSTDKDCPSDFRSLLWQELIFSGLSVVVFSLLLTYNSFIRESCSPGAGYFSFFVTLIPPLLFNSALGTLSATLIRPLWLRIPLVFLGYFAYFAFIIANWWHETTFRIVTHLSLILNSDLLQGGSLSLGLIEFRGATLLFALACIVFGYTFRTSPTTRIFKEVISHPIKNSFLIIFLLGLGTLLHWQSVQSLGKNRAALEKDFSLSVSKNNIDVRSDPTRVARIDAENILHEALLYQKRIAKLLPPRMNAPITIWLHPDDESKFLYTGAQNVHFALPHHREIHISLASIPHPVLGHELAHIYVGEYSKTILGLPGQFGLIPNMALTEGLAMYLTPELALDNDLTLLEQAQGLFQAGFNISTERLFALNPTEFARSNPRSSYIFAGAFLEFALLKTAKKISSALEDVMSQGRLDALFISREEQKRIEKDFMAELASKAPSYAARWAKNNFISFSILGNDCLDPYRAQKALFKEACLNNLSSKALKSLESVPSESKIPLIHFAAQTLLNEEHYEISNQLLAFLLADTSLTLEKTTLELLYLDTLIHLDRLDQAKNTLDRIAEASLSQPEKRQFTIAHNVLNAPSISDLGRAILEIAFAKNTTLSSRAVSLGFQVGLMHHEKNQETITGQYLYARLLLKDKKYSQALHIIEEIQNNKHLLLEGLYLETNLMQAETYYNLKNYQQSKDIYLSLGQQNLSAGTKLFISDKLDRINYVLTLEN